MTKQSMDYVEDNNDFIKISEILQEYKFDDNSFEQLLSVINDENAFKMKLFELAGFDIQESFDGFMYSVLLDAFEVSIEENPALIEIPKELMALRFADRIKEAIKQHTPEYYNFANQINYYDYRLLPILTLDCKNPREIIETVFRDKAIDLISEFILCCFPEIDHVLKELDDEIIEFIIPSILEYNRTTISDRKAVMKMILNPEKLFVLRTENSEMSDVIVQTLLEQLDKKRTDSFTNKTEDKA